MSKRHSRLNNRKFDINKPSTFTKRVLNKVDQDRWYWELLILRNSYAARDVFAHLQYVMHSVHDYGDMECMQFSEIQAYCTALSAISCEVAHRCNGIGLSGYGFRRLAEELEVPIETNEWGDGFIRTINGWWQI